MANKEVKKCRHLEKRGDLKDRNPPPKVRGEFNETLHGRRQGGKPRYLFNDASSATQLTGNLRRGLRVFSKKRTLKGGRRERRSNPLEEVKVA